MELYLYSSYGPSWTVIGRTLPLTTLFEHLVKAAKMNVCVIKTNGDFNSHVISYKIQEMNVRHITNYHTHFYFANKQRFCTYLLSVLTDTMILSKPTCICITLTFGLYCKPYLDTTQRTASTKHCHCYTLL